MLRRSFLALPLLVAVARADKTAAPAWWLGDVVPKAGPGTILASRFGAKSVVARMAKKVVPREVTLTAHNNSNTEFTMWVVFPRQKDERELFLSADGGWFSSGGFGHDDTGSQASFMVDRPTAERIAKALQLPLNERTKLDAGLVATWVFPPALSMNAKGPVLVKLRVKNTGAVTVGFAIGGQQRGPRDNRFEFKISRNGSPVAIKDAPDFGGLMYYKALKTGEEHELSVDLRSWADLALPGHYQIDAVYRGELAKNGEMPSTAADRKNLWDVSLTGQGAILIQ